MASSMTDKISSQVKSALSLGSGRSGPKKVSVNWKEIFEDADDDNELPEDFVPPRSFFNKRKSVAAERVDPDDEDDDDVSVSHPKTEEQRAKLEETVKKVFMFRNLVPSETKEILEAMFLKRVVDGEVVILQGDDGDNFYVADEGEFDIFIKDNDDDEGHGVHKGTVVAGGFFGELALMYNQPRAASIVARGAGAVWGLDRKTFRRIVVKNAQSRRRLFEEIIQSVPMLAVLKESERMSVCDALQPRSFAEGDVIVRQGDEGDSMFFVEDGLVRVVAEKDGKERELTELKKGAYFGELALVTQKPRAATVIAATPTVAVAELHVHAFERLLGPCMEIMKRNVELYNEQMQEIFKN